MKTRLGIGLVCVLASFAGLVHRATNRANTALADEPIIFATCSAPQVGTSNVAQCAIMCTAACECTACCNKAFPGAADEDYYESCKGRCADLYGSCQSDPIDDGDPEPPPTVFP